jgi:hypothetical protein
MCVIELDPLPAIIPDIFRDELTIGKAKQYYDEEIYK